MDVSTLKLFVEVMRRRSFTQVAKTGRMAPSSVSRAIASLETELGTRLFQRSTRRLEPTEAGLRYFERVEPLLEELTEAGMMVADSVGQPRGTLRVSAPTVFGQMFLVPVVAELHEKHPDLGIELLLNDAYVDLVGERIDVAIRLGTLSDSSDIARRVRMIRYYICASPQYLKRHGAPATPRELARHECLLFPRGGYSLSWLFRDASGAVEEVQIDGRCLITNSESIRQCALSGMGLALLPDWLVEPDIESGTLCALFDDYEVTATDYDSAIWILQPSRAYVPLKARVFVERLLDRCSDTAVRDKRGKHVVAHRATEP
ncbi:MAG TPA: LysR family transcriptional regulator [Gammaproteobacteria bacterium]|nr:LysR family transcriptional regulator [Gammaproteobacteria bacterium]